jgi:1-deoxy-D-xylulose-5-phosphate reductoisomerase
LLFGAPCDAIEVVIHPQSVVHSLVEYVDGSVLAQLGHPDMLTPIAQALAYPDRIATDVPALDLARLASLEFEAPDFARFPCLRLAYDALRAGDMAPPVLNAANEVAVAAFLRGRLAFTDIAAACEEALSRTAPRPVACLDDALEADRQTRASVNAWLAAHAIQGTVAA